MQSLRFPPQFAALALWGMSRTAIKRLILLLFLLILLVGGLFWFYPGYCASQARNAIFMQDLPTAEKWIERGEATGLKQPEFAFIRARYYRKKSQFLEMSHQLKLAKTLGYAAQTLQREQWLAFAQTGKMEQLEKHFAELLQAGDDLSEVCDAYIRGCILLYRIDEAFQLLDKWETDLPQDPQAPFLKGRLLEHVSDTEGAENSFRKSLQLSPRYAAAAYNLARILVAKQKYEEAIQNYQRSNKLMKVKQPGLIGMAECYLQLQQYEKARQILEQCDKENEKELEETYRYLGDPVVQAKAKYFTVYGKLELALEHYPDAIRYYEQALAINPYDWQVRYNYSLALKQVGRKEEAIQEAEKVTEAKKALAMTDVLIDKLRKNPADIEARYQVGVLILKYISEYQGLTWLRSVLRYDPNHKATLEILQKYDHSLNSP